MSSVVKFIEFQERLDKYRVRKIAPKILSEFTTEEKKIILNFLKLTLKEIRQVNQELLDNEIKEIKNDKY